MGMKMTFSISRLMCALFLCGASALALSQAAPLSPAQVAWVKAEQARAQTRFAERVASALQTKRSVVERALPGGARIADPVPRIIATLERDLKRTLSEAEKAEVRAAEAAWREQAVQAESQARKH